MSEKRKIAILLPNLMFGGGERVSLTLAEALADLGVIVEFVLIKKEGELIAQAEENFKVIDLKCNSSLAVPLRLLQYVVKNRPYAVISNYWAVNVLACLTRMIFPAFKLLVCEHSPPSRTPFIPTFLYCVTATLFYQASHKIIAVSNGVGSDIRECTYGLSKKLEVIYNAIKESSHAGFIDRTARVSPRPRIISVGRLKLQKNQALLLHAFALVVRNIDAELIIVGDGELLSDLQRLAARLGIADHVQFVGYHSQPSDLMAESDLFVLSSDYEGLPTVIVEALYVGLPIVSTDCPHGPREILMDGKYGSLTKVGDAVSLAEGIKGELSRFRDPGLQKAGAERFLPRIVANHYLAVLALSTN